MRLRKLDQKDAPLMLEWMHDDDVVRDLSADFKSMTIQDCVRFITDSQDGDSDYHMAIVSDDDEYMGTVSLKHIDKGTHSAEFAITVRKAAMSKGYSWFGMSEMLRMGFDNLDLTSIYWCVSRDNIRACRFYDKHNYHHASNIPDSIKQRYSGVDNLLWYAAYAKDDYLNCALAKGSVAGCRIVKIRTIASMDAGELSFFESANDIGFNIKRIYYITRVPEGAQRGFHAHKELKQLLFCPYGKIQITLENDSGRDAIVLSDPAIGILIDKLTWREMLWLEKDSVLCVAASEYYNPDDYIRDYDAFIEAMS